MRVIGVALSALALVAASPGTPEILTNRLIVALSASGIGDEAIIAKIQSSDAKFDLSTDQMLALKKKGVSGPVIAAMIAADNHDKQRGVPSASAASSARSRSVGTAVAAASRPAGIYLVSGGQLIRIDFNVSGQTRTGGMLGTMMSAV